MFRFLALFLAPLVVCSGAACVSYRRQVVDVPSTVRSFRPTPACPLAFEGAVRLLVERNAELRRLRAEAASVNVNPGPDALLFRTEVVRGDVGETMIGTDILSLLGIGPRQAQEALARSQRSELVLRHHERARALVAALAEAYAVDAVLRSLESPRPVLDVDAFEKAGLASKASLAAAASALAQADAEDAVVATALKDTRREIARLIAASPDTVLEPIPVGRDWPPVPPPEAQALLYARGDLLRLQGAFEVADRRLRLAVTEQWPRLGIFLGGNIRLEWPMQAVAIAFPLDAPAEARAMACAREAARRGFEEAVLDAMHDAASARFALESADAKVKGARARRDAAAALGRAAQARIETEAERAFADAVLAALEEVRAATVYREAAVARARAQARAALAAGWPRPVDVEGLQ